jgi:NADPH-dependent ferric siderophore reductase
MPESPKPRQRPAPLRMIVIRSERITPHMQRVVLGGPAFDQFAERTNAHTDKYAKLTFVHPASPAQETLDVDALKATLPQDQWPVVRTYTVRSVDLVARELTIDFVVHGDEGVAGPWAAASKPGDVLHLTGPGGAYSPRSDVDWHLLIGDEAALPAISSAIEAMPFGMRATAFIEVDGPAEEQKIDSAGDVDIVWLHRNGAPAGSTDLLGDAVKSMDWPAGSVQVFMHGEAGLLKSLRAHLLTERGVDKSLASISGYWRVGNTEEGFRTWKSEQSKAESS